MKKTGTAKAGTERSKTADHHPGSPGWSILIRLAATWRKTMANADTDLRTSGQNSLPDPEGFGVV